MAAVEELAESVVLWGEVEGAGALLSKSITCVLDGTVDLTFAFFHRRSSLVGLPSPILHFEGLAPRKEGDIKRMRE